MNTPLHCIKILRIALDVPPIARALAACGEDDGAFDYRCVAPVIPGQRVIVPWGHQIVIGLVLAVVEKTDLEPERLREVIAVLDDMAPLPDEWLALVRFAANYYHRTVGEVALPALPALLRRAAGYRTTAAGLQSRSMDQLRKRLAKPAREAAPHGTRPSMVLSAEQQYAVGAIAAALRRGPRFEPILLHGVTGSGKTEVYLHALADVLASGRQALVLIPEINLTPQLEQLFRARLPQANIATLHSAMPDAQRAAHWLRVHEGSADLLLGTRMAILAPMPRLGLIIVDEEHDASFKQQEGLRYSARDLALVRAQQRGIPVILGSATPSLETWLSAQRGRYSKLALTSRAIEAASLPEVQLLDLKRETLEHGLSATLVAHLEARLARAEQSLIFLNRRGYAPVLSCNACGWVSDCRRCSAHVVFHRSDHLLHCHHCGWQTRVPRACPKCGNADLVALGRGTQRVEETLRERFPQARIARIDRDSTRRKGSAQSLFESMHAGDVDILVGTQMVAKGHDFHNLTLVGVLDPDNALFSHDFRAAERLFANLMQVAGRAGRRDKPGEVLIQTRFPNHPLFQALSKHDYEGFAFAQLAEREAVQLPPYSHQVLLRAEAPEVQSALAFLLAARAATEGLVGAEQVTVYDPVPMVLVRLANRERAQLLAESLSRRALQEFLTAWLLALRAIKTRVLWHVEVDPLDI